MQDASRHPRAATGRRASAARRAAAVIVLGAIVAMCVATLTARGQQYVPGTDADFPRILEPDSMITMNDRCMVRQNKMTLTIRPVYVNFHPVGFC